MSTPKAWFKIGTSECWSRVSLYRIECVADIKYAIKANVAPKLDDQSLLDLTLKAWRQTEDEGNAVVLDEQETLASVLQRFGIKSTSQDPIKLFADNLHLFLFSNATPISLPRKLTELGLLSYYPPSLNYIKTEGRSKKTIKFRHAQTPRAIHIWNDFLVEVAAMTFGSTVPVYDPPRFFNSLSVLNEEGIREAFNVNVLMLLSNTIGSSHTPPEVFRRQPGRTVQGNPDFVFQIGDYSAMPIEVKPKWILPVDYIVKTFKQNEADYRQGLTSPGLPSVIDSVKQIFGYMVHNRLQYGVLSTYDGTWFLKRPSSNPDTLYISHVVTRMATKPTLLQCLAYIMSLARTDPKSPLPDDRDDNHKPKEEKKDEDDKFRPSEESTCSKRKRDADDKESKGSSSSKQSRTTREGKQRAGGSKRSRPKEEFGLIDFGWNYDVVDVLGWGRSGKVFKAIWRGEEVALKLCDLWQHPEYEEELLWEVKLYAVLKELQGHVIPKLKGAGYTGGGLFAIATEIVGSSIEVAQLSDKERNEVVNALSEIHNRGVLHNDISAENIFIQRNPHGSKISFIDFGCSKIVSSKTPLRHEMVTLKRMFGFDRNLPQAVAT